MAVSRTDTVIFSRWPWCDVSRSPKVKLDYAIRFATYEFIFVFYSLYEPPKPPLHDAPAPDSSSALSLASPSIRNSSDTYTLPYIAHNVGAYMVAWLSKQFAFAGARIVSTPRHLCHGVVVVVIVFENWKWVVENYEFSYFSTFPRQIKKLVEFNKLITIISCTQFEFDYEFYACIWGCDGQTIDRRG